MLCTQRYDEGANMDEVECCALIHHCPTRTEVGITLSASSDGSPGPYIPMFYRYLPFLQIGSQVDVGSYLT